MAVDVAGPATSIDEELATRAARRSPLARAERDESDRLALGMPEVYVSGGTRDRRQSPDVVKPALAVARR